jgi:hypothetical protein
MVRRRSLRASCRASGRDGGWTQLGAAVGSSNAELALNRSGRLSAERIG